MPENSRTGSSGTLAWIIPNATVFISSFCIMVLELVAGRLVARHLGASLYTWTAAIGVFLAGIAIGNFIGGRLADRYEAKRTLSTLFILASATCVTISLFDNFISTWLWPYRLSYPLRVALHVTVVFLLPSTLLGTISPVVAKMALELGRLVGRTIGNIYAWGMLGSIVGTFLTGYFLIAILGTVTIVYVTAAILALMSILYGFRSWKPWGWTALLILFIVVGIVDWGWARLAGERLSLRMPPDPDIVFSDETQYSYIEVRRDPQVPGLRYMMLDQLLHSTILINNPYDLQYGYETVYAALTHRLSRNKEKLKTLTIGGGGVVFPRYLEAKWPGSLTELAEIDPGVTAAAFKAFALQPNTKIKIHHLDGRVYVDHLANYQGREKDFVPYDFVYGDAFSHVSIPFQLTTLEFYKKVKSLLAPDGAYIMNLVDIFNSGQFLSAVLHTMEEVFPHVNVFVTSQRSTFNKAHHNTFVILGTMLPFEERNLCIGYKPDCGALRISKTDLEKLRKNGSPIILTDDYAPVENLLGEVAGTHFLFNASGWRLKRAWSAFKRGDSERGLWYARSVLELQPRDARTHTDIALLYRRYGLNREAEEVLQRGLSIDPFDPIAHSWMGIILAEEGEWYRAIEHHSRARSLNPDLEMVKKNFNRAINQAVEAEENVLRSDPDNAKAHRDLATFYYLKASFAKAIEHGDRAEELGNPVPPGLQRELDRRRQGSGMSDAGTPQRDHPDD